MERIRNRLVFANGLCVPCVGQSGGLALLWTREVDIEIKSYSKNHIDAVVKEQGSNFCWRLTSFYRHPETHRRYELWHLLAFLNSQFQLPWLCLGDFNEILSITEKKGVLSEPNNKWMDLEGLLIIAIFRIWVIVGLIILGVICRKEIIV